MANDKHIGRAEQSSGSTGRVLRSGRVTNPPISEKAKGKRPMEFEDKAKGKVPMLVRSGALTIREPSQEGESTGDKRKAISEPDQRHPGHTSEPTTNKTTNHLLAYASQRESYSWHYDVFLSFRGEDTRNNFTSFLFAALKNNGFHTFHDSRLPRGQEIAPKLLEAIEQSQLSIVVFSKNYADSRWCLDELVKINDCRRRSRSGCKVLPVFLDVEPSDVRKQEGCYKQAFLRHCSARRKFTTERIDRWRKALFETGNLSGHHLQNDANGDEEMFVRQIVEKVASILKRPHLHVANHPVGIEPRVQEVCSLLDANAAKQDGVGIVVIWGIGGIGKTTIAKATFNFLAPYFEGCSFLADVRSTCGKDDGVVKLQKQLISDLRNEKNTQDVAIRDYHHGTQQIKGTICSRRVLLVVDDANSFQQLEMLAINRKYLQSGSKVLVTTRDESWTRILEQVSVYEPRELNKEDSLKLFTWYAIGNKDPHKEGYKDLLEQVNELAEGIPLVLEVWGAEFRSSHVENWHLLLSKLSKVPHDDVQAKLRISYDSLNKEQKGLFLDIACFFIGMEEEFVIGVLKDKASGWFPELEIEMLLSRCLVRLDYSAGGSLIMMHDVIRDMGREIVRQESPEDPEKRTRLWDRHDVLRVLEDCSVLYHCLCSIGVCRNDVEQNQQDHCANSCSYTQMSCRDIRGVMKKCYNTLGKVSRLWW